MNCKIRRVFVWSIVACITLAVGIGCSHGQTSKKSFGIPSSYDSSLFTSVDTVYAVKETCFKIDSTNYLTSSHLNLSDSGFQNVRSKILSIRHHVVLNGDTSFSLRKFKKYTSLSGTVQNSSSWTNYRDPFTLSEKLYNRTYGDLNVSAFNIPFEVKFYLTTEDNSHFNSNFISIGFDRSSMTDALNQKCSEKLALIYSVKDTIQNLRQTNLQKKKDLQSIQGELLEEKKELLKLANQEKEKLTLGLNESVGNKMTLYRDSLEGLRKLAVDSFHAVGFMVANSNHVNQDSIQSRLDSIQQYQEELSNKIRQADSLGLQLDQLDSTIAQRILQLRRVKNNPNELASTLQDRPIIQKLIGVASKIDQFQLGVTYPTYSELSLNGTPNKGVHLELGNNSNRWMITGGKTFDLRFNTYGGDQPSSNFTRNLGGLSFEREIGKTRVGSSVVGLWDHLESTASPQRNVIQNIWFDAPIGAKANIHLITGFAAYNENAARDEGQSWAHFGSVLPSSAFKSKLSYRPKSTTKIKLESRAVMPGFVNLANPFMRNDFFEYKLSLSQKLLKRRLTANFFYSALEDNLFDHGVTTNRMSGYGITLQTNFRKYPNLMVQHSPYVQGNNHPDSILRTNNQLSVSTATLSYQRPIGAAQFVTVIAATRSQIEFLNFSNPVENRFINAYLLLQNDKFSGSLNVYRNLSLPAVDSLNYSGIRLQMNYGKKLNYQCSGFYDRYESSAERWLLNAGMTGKLLNCLTLKGLIGVGRIRGLFGIQTQPVLQSQFDVCFSF